MMHFLKTNVNGRVLLVLALMYF